MHDGRGPGGEELAGEALDSGHRHGAVARRGGGRPVNAHQAVPLQRLGPLRELGQGLGAGAGRGVGARGEVGDRGRVGGGAEAEMGVDGSEQYGLVGGGFREHGREGFHGLGHRRVVDGDGGLAHDRGIGVRQESREVRAAQAAQREDGAEAHGGGGVGGRRGQRGAVPGADQAHHDTVAEDGVGVVVGAEGLEQRRCVGRAPQASERLSGEVTHARLGVAEEAGEILEEGRREAGVVRMLSGEFQRLGSNLTVGVGRGPLDGRERGGIFLTKLA